MELMEIYWDINKMNSFNWYTDGSCTKQHYNYGGFGYVTLQDRNVN